jgi:hypothetical protein
VGLYIHSSIRLHCVVLDYLSKGKIYLPYFRYPYIDGKFRGAYTGLSLRNIAYTCYDVSWFVEYTDSMNRNFRFPDNRFYYSNIIVHNVQLRSRAYYVQLSVLKLLYSYFILILYKTSSLRYPCSVVTHIHCL